MRWSRAACLDRNGDIVTVTGPQPCDGVTYSVSNTIRVPVRLARGAACSLASQDKMTERLAEWWQRLRSRRDLDDFILRDMAFARGEPRFGVSKQF